MLSRPVPVLGTFLTFVLLFGFGSSYSVGPAILLAWCIFQQFSGAQGCTAFPHLRVFWPVAALLLISPIISDVLPTGAFRELDIPSKGALALLLLRVLSRAALPPSLLYAGVTIGAVLSLVIANWEIQSSGGRLSLGLNPIQTGGLLTMQALLVAAVIAWLVFVKRSLASFLLSLPVFAIFVGLVWANFQTQSRGAWVGLLLGLVAAVIAWLHETTAPRWLKLSVPSSVAIAIFGLAYAAEGPRILQAYSEFQAFLNGQVVSSTGYRLELWRATLAQWQMAPWFGAGQHGYLETKQLLIENGSFHAGIGKFGHAHNNFLDILAKRGVFGLAVFAVWFVGLLMVGYQQYRIAGASYRPIWCGLVAVVSGCVGCMFTQAFLSHNSGMMVFSFWSVILLAVLCGGASKATSPPPAAS